MLHHSHGSRRRTIRFPRQYCKYRGVWFGRDCRCGVGPRGEEEAGCRWKGGDYRLLPHVRAGAGCSVGRYGRIVEGWKSRLDLVSSFEGERRNARADLGGYAGCPLFTLDSSLDCSGSSHGSLSSRCKSSRMVLSLPSSWVVLVSSPLLSLTSTTQPMTLIGIIVTVGSGYIAADTALTITDYFQSSPPQDLHSIWLFVLTIIWPAAAAAFYFIVQLGVVVRVLKEKKPLSMLDLSLSAPNTR